MRNVLDVEYQVLSVAASKPSPCEAPQATAIDHRSPPAPRVTSCPAAQSLRPSEVQVEIDSADPEAHPCSRLEKDIEFRSFSCLRQDNGEFGLGIGHATDDGVAGVSLPNGLLCNQTLRAYRKRRL